MTDWAIINAKVASLDVDINRAYGWYDNGAVLISGGVISWVGDMANLPKFDLLRTPTIDAKGQLLTPGLIDCHTHILFAGSRANEFELRLQGKNYAEIAAEGGGILNTVKATREASSESLFDLARQRLNALMSQGVSSVEIKSGYGLDLETEQKILEVATQLKRLHPLSIQRTFLGAHAIPIEYQNDSDAYVNYICDTVLPAIATNKLADAVDGFCEHIAFNAKQLAKVFSVANKFNLPVKLHAEQLSNQGGAQLVAQYNGLSADHLEYLSESDIQAMAKNDVVAVLLPGAFYFLKERKKPPIEQLMQYRVPIAIATDFNPGSSPLCDIRLMMNFACTLFSMTPEQALRGVTCNAAQALGYKDRGIIKPGLRADLALWRCQHPAELSYQLGVPLLEQLWIKGTAIQS